MKKIGKLDEPYDYVTGASEYPIQVSGAGLSEIRTAVNRLIDTVNRQQELLSDHIDDYARHKTESTHLETTDKEPLGVKIARKDLEFNVRAMASPIVDKPEDGFRGELKPLITVYAIPSVQGYTINKDEIEDMIVALHEKYK